MRTVDNGNEVDGGEYPHDDNDDYLDGYFNASIVEKFEVTPLDLGVGMFPVTYRFRVTPGGEVPAGSYFEIELPDEIRINDESAIEKSCGGVYRDTLLAFTHEIDCKIQGDTIIKIEDGFKYFATANFSDPAIDNDYDPPEFWFDLPQFINPRETTDTNPFNITIYNADKEKIYVWNTTDEPTVKMSGAATPGYFNYIRESPTNGNITWYEF